MQLLRRWAPQLGLFAGLVVVAAALWPGLSGSFLFDDFGNLEPLAKYHPSQSWEAMRLFLAENRHFAGRLVAMLTFALQEADWPSNPWPFKFVNLVLHLVNACLVFLLARTITGSAHVVAPGPQREAVMRWAPPLAAVGWAASPIHVSAIMLVVQRMTGLMAFFVLLGTWLCALAVTARNATPARRATLAWAGLFPVGALAVLSKENGVLLPIFVLVTIYTVLRTDFLALDLRTRRLVAAPPLALAVCVAIALLAYIPTAINGYGLRDFTLAERLLTQPRTLLLYLYGFALPLLGKFGLFHDDVAVSRTLLSPWTTLPAILAVAAALGTALALRKRAPLFAFAVLWFLGGHLVESTYVPLELYFEHRNYVPLVGPCIALAIKLVQWFRGGTRYPSLLAVVWLAASLMASVLNAKIWGSPTALAVMWHEQHPHSARAAANLAQSLMLSGRLQEGVDLLRKARDGMPGNSALAAQTAWLACEAKSISPADVDALLATAARGGFSHEMIQTLSSFRGQILRETCPEYLNFPVWDRLTAALLSNPRFTGYSVSNGLINYQIAMSYVSRDDLNRTLEYLDKVEVIDPDPTLFLLRANILSELGRYDEALAMLARGERFPWPVTSKILVGHDQRYDEMRAAILARKSGETQPKAKPPATSPAEG